MTSRKDPFHFSSSFDTIVVFLRVCVRFWVNVGFDQLGYFIAEYDVRVLSLSSSSSGMDEIRRRTRVRRARSVRFHGWLAARSRAGVAVRAGPRLAVFEGNFDDADEDARGVDAKGFHLGTGERGGPRALETNGVGISRGDRDGADLVPRAKVAAGDDGGGTIDWVRLGDLDDAGVRGDRPRRGRRLLDA